MKYTVFVDGQAGTTGLEIHERISKRTDLELLEIDPEKRKDPETRRLLMNRADVVFLCLPDAAAIESAALITNGSTRVIDASTAHRTNPDWVYGLPELDREQRQKIAASKRLANPGCHATGFALAIPPLVRNNIISPSYPVTVHSVTGYSGGGKKVIELFEGGSIAPQVLNSPRHYALGLAHKHLPEMQRVSGLDHPPLFTPIIGNFYRGMVVSVPFHIRLFGKKVTALNIHEMFSEYYSGERFIRVMPWESESDLPDGYFDPTACNGTNRADIFVFGNTEQVLVMVRLDNLGKGASGAAIQNMNIMLGVEESSGLL